MSKIKELIDRQLCENYEDQFNTMGCHEKEQEKRELLKALIEIERCYELLINCSPMRANVKLIEKHLKMKWKEIIDF